MKANLATTIGVYCTGGQTEGSDLVDINETPAVRDIIRHRLVKTNPDVDAADEQKDNAGFIGKKYRVQDKQYGNDLSEHDDSDSAETASLARPYSRVLHVPELKQLQTIRNKSIKKAATTNPDVE